MKPNCCFTSQFHNRIPLYKVVLEANVLNIYFISGVIIKHVTHIFSILRRHVSCFRSACMLIFWCLLWYNKWFYLYVIKVQAINVSENKIHKNNKQFIRICGLVLFVKLIHSQQQLQWWNSELFVSSMLQL